MDKNINYKHPIFINELINKSQNINILIDELRKFNLFKESSFSTNYNSKNEIESYNFSFKNFYFYGNELEIKIFIHGILFSINQK